MFLVCNLLKFIQAPYFLTSADGKYNLLEKKISISTYKYRLRKRSEKFVIFKAANDRHSIKIGILKSMIKLLAKYLLRSFFSKALDNSPKTLLKMNSVTNAFQGFQTSVLTQLLHKTAVLRNIFFERFCSTGIYLLKFNRINKHNVQS